ncbi:MAG: hypothetical protein ABFS03_11070, partial [Chloroflexota bacterium]
MSYQRSFHIQRAVSILLLLAVLFQPYSYVEAASTLSIEPNTWNVIGLDSNSPAVGPYRFPVGAKICSTVSTADIVVDFHWDDGNDPYAGDAAINLRSDSLQTITIPSIAANTCEDAFFEVEVTQSVASFGATRAYHITADDGIADIVSTPQPRELFVETLISQNRNSIVSDVTLDGVSIAPGEMITFMEGNTYTLAFYGGTAVQGYNQFEGFMDLPNTIFQILSVESTYSANSVPLPQPYPYLYADACGWDNDPNSPTYLSCIGGDDKVGGTNVVTTYEIKIIGGAGTTDILRTLLFDFSGSSLHYNADFIGEGRQFEILGPSSVTMAKTFSPKAVTSGDPSVLTIALTNPIPEDITGSNFIDAFPSGMALYDTATINSCGGVLADKSGGALNVGDDGIQLTGGTIPADGSCTITVNVTAASDGTYDNTTGNLFIDVNGTNTDTGNNAADTLKVDSSAVTCTPGQTLATWTFEPAAGTTVPPLFTTKAANVSTATASYTGGTQSIDTTIGSPAANAWAGDGFVKNFVNTAYTSPYFVITVDTSLYSDVEISLRSYATANWGTDNTLKVWSSSDGGTVFSATTPATGILAKKAWSGDQTFTASSTGAATTIFRINADGANPTGAEMLLDNIIVTGCSFPIPPPTLSKSFSPDPIAEGNTTTLTFTIENTAAGSQDLTGISFSDVLPTGLSVANSTTSACNGTNNLATTAATGTIELTGGTLAAGTICTFSVTVTGVSAGDYENITGFLSSIETGETTSYATDTLTVIAPPEIAKSFSPTAIFTGETSRLSFTITNPNLFYSLSGVGFNDSPLSAAGGLEVANPNGLSGSCGGGTITANPGSTAISLSGATLAAGGSCTFSVDVTATSPGEKVNTTGVVTSIEGGDGNTASATLVVLDKTAAVDLTKQVSTDNINWYKFVGQEVGGDIYYRFLVYNSG